MGHPYCLGTALKAYIFYVVLDISNLPVHRKWHPSTSSAKGNRSIVTKSDLSLSSVSSYQTESQSQWYSFCHLDIPTSQPVVKHTYASKTNSQNIKAKSILNTSFNLHKLWINLCELLQYLLAGPPRGGGSRGYFPGAPKLVSRKGAPLGFFIFYLSGAASSRYFFFFRFP